MKKIISVLVLALMAAGMSLTAQNRVDSIPEMRGFARQGQIRGQMDGQQMGQMRGQMARVNAPLAQGRGQMMNKRAQMLQGRGFQNGRFVQVQGCPCCKKNVKAFAKQAKRFRKAPMVNPELRIKNQVERMTKQLDLTPDQAAKIQAIQEKHFKKDIAKYKKFEKKRDAQFKKRHGNLDEIKAVLTPEQAQKLESLKAQAPRMNGQGFQGGRNKGPNGPRGPMPGFGQGGN